MSGSVVDIVNAQYDATAKAAKSLAVNASGHSVAGPRVIFSYTGPASGLAAAQSTPHDLGSYYEVHMQCSVTAVASGTLNVTFFGDIWDVTGTSFINGTGITPAITGAYATPSYGSTRIAIYTGAAWADALVTSTGAQGKYLGAVPFRNKLSVLNTGGTAALADITIDVRIYGR